MNNWKFRFVDTGFRLVINSVRWSWHCIVACRCAISGLQSGGLEATVTTVAVQAPCTNWIDLPNHDICQAIATSSIYQNCKMTKNVLSMDAAIYIQSSMRHFVMLYKSWKLISTNQVFKFTSKYEQFWMLHCDQYFTNLENIFDPYLQLYEIGQHKNEMHEYTRCSVHSVWR
jgi:hypothetical protein